MGIQWQINKQKRLFKKNLGCQIDIRETNSDYEMEKKIICKYLRFLKKIKTVIISWYFFYQLFVQFTSNFKYVIFLTNV